MYSMLKVIFFCPKVRRALLIGKNFHMYNILFRFDGRKYRVSFAHNS